VTAIYYSVLIDEILIHIEVLPRIEELPNAHLSDPFAGNKRPQDVRGAQTGAVKRPAIGKAKLCRPMAERGSSSLRIEARPDQSVRTLRDHPAIP
jgi:hypothetical protein